MWKVVCGCLLINLQRIRRHMTNSDLCPVCLILASLSFIFCMIVNLCQRFDIICFMLIWLFFFFLHIFMDYGLYWSILFVAVLDNVWKARNDLIFSNFVPIACGSATKVRYQVTSKSNTHLIHARLSSVLTPTQRWFVWHYLEDCWVAHNGDGAFQNLNGMVACGGIVCDDTCDFIFDYFYVFGECTISMTKL